VGATSRRDKRFPADHVAPISARFSFSSHAMKRKAVCEGLRPISWVSSFKLGSKLDCHARE
jgi:hypothetical protein